MEWPDYPWTKLSAEAVLDNWRGRIARVETEESDSLARLPYVKGVAVIGGVGRSSPWPLSDIDMLVAADVWEGRDPEERIQQEEHKRNACLTRQRIPNNIESSEWVILTRDLSEAVTESDDAFFTRLEHSHWLGIVIKGEGCHVAHDFDGRVQAFLDRCTQTFYTDRFIELWAHKVITYCSKQLAVAEAHIRDGHYIGASLEILRTAYQQLRAGRYAIWRRVPQSSARSVTRFLSATREAQDHTIERLYLAASCLEECTVWERFGTVPAQGKEMRDLMWAIRRGAGEALDELSVTRDTLNLSLWKTVVTNSSDEPRPPWTGVTGDPGEVQRQYEAAQSLLARLSAETGKPATGSRRRSNSL